MKDIPGIVMNDARCAVLSLVFKVAILFSMASTLLLSGCTSIRVHMGMRVRLDKLPVNAMVVTMPQNPGIAPGEKSPLVATFTDAKGKTWVTEGKGKGKILWSDIVVAPTLVTFKKGNLRLADDPRVSDEKTGHVDVVVPSHPDLKAAFDVPVRYDYPFVAGYSGSSGSSGSAGQSGNDGSDGSSGSSDPEHPSAGGNGGNGTSGSAGSNGGDGGNGPDVSVQVTLRAGVHPLLQAVVSTGPRDRSPKYFLVDPNGGSLSVSSAGGSGGAGGKGGRGGRGGSGAAEFRRGRVGVRGRMGRTAAAETTGVTAL